MNNEETSVIYYGFGERPEDEPPYVLELPEWFNTKEELREKVDKLIKENQPPAVFIAKLFTGQEPVIVEHDPQERETLELEPDKCTILIHETREKPKQASFSIIAGTLEKGRIECDISYPEPTRITEEIVLPKRKLPAIIGADELPSESIVGDALLILENGEVHPVYHLNKSSEGWQDPKRDVYLRVADSGEGLVFVIPKVSEEPTETVVPKDDPDAVSIIAKAIQDDCDTDSAPRQQLMMRVGDTFIYMQNTRGKTSYFYPSGERLAVRFGVMVVGV